MQKIMYMLSVQTYDYNHTRLYGHRIFLEKHSKKQVTMVASQKGSWKSEGNREANFPLSTPLYPVSFMPSTCTAWSKIEKYIYNSLEDKQNLAHQKCNLWCPSKLSSNKVIKLRAGNVFL